MTDNKIDPRMEALVDIIVPFFSTQPKYIDRNAVAEMLRRTPEVSRDMMVDAMLHTAGADEAFLIMSHFMNPSAEDEQAIRLKMADWIKRYRELCGNVTFSRYVIYGVKLDGSKVELFTWTRSKQAGIDRAKADAKLFGRDHEFMDYTAEPI